MKPPVKITLSAVVVVATLIALPYLLIFYRPSSPDQLLGQQIFDQDNASPPQQSKAGSSNVQSTATSSNETVQITPTVESAGACSNETEETALAAMLERAATGDKTVIITTLNQAWTKPGTMLDVFLDSFHRGEGTQLLLRHLVMVALDQQSLERCQQVHAHCFRLTTDGVDFSGSKGFMTDDFLKMMWRRMSLLRTVLELGYNFVFTDADILWLRNPFEHFSNDADFQISCDKNRGNAWSLLNKPNCGYQYARSNERTIAMYRHWCNGGENNPHIDEQSLLNIMLHSKAFVPYKVRIRFLSTEEFSGFCNGGKNMSRVVTMHANCCTGLSNKVKDLRKALRAWELGKSSPEVIVKKPQQLWHVPDACRHSIWPSPPPPSLLANVST
jgi:hypothetical protein